MKRTHAEGFTVPIVEEQEDTEARVSSSEHEEKKKKRKVDWMVDGDLEGLRDEWTIVLEFLPIGSILMLGMTSKKNYGWICGYVRRLANILVESGLGGGFSLTGMLRMKKKLIVDSNDFDQVKKILQEISSRNGSLSELTNGFIFDGIEFDKLYSLLDVRKGLGYLEELRVDTVCLPKKEILKLERIIIQKQIKGVPIGYELTNLTIIMNFALPDLYKILAKCKNLETCQIDIEECLTDKKKPSTETICKECEEISDENYVHAPVMLYLKSLHVSSFEDNEQFMFDLLKICPNLERLHYSCYATPSNQFLKFLSTMCPKLKKMVIETEFSEMTDDDLVEFLTNQKEMEHLDIRPTPMISGKLFKQLDQFTKLKYFRIRRCNHYSSVAPPLIENVQFGSNSIPSLQYLDIGANYKFTSEEEYHEFVNSLQKVAPNLKDFYEMDKLSMDYSGRLITLFSNTLEATIGNLSNISELYLCTNLKKVVLQLPENSRFAGIPICPNVVELKCQFALDSTSLLQLSKTFPSVEVCEISGFKQSMDPFVELFNDPTVWPNLVYLKVTTGKKAKLSKIVKARPSVYIESKVFPVTPQTFNYLWLVRDLYSIENLLT